MKPTDLSGAGLAERFIVILNQTQDIVNIAGTARAMLNMGLERLRLVRPDEYDEHRITGIAHGSERLLERIEFFDTLADAIADTGYVVGTTARRRTAAYVWDHPRAAAPRLLRLAQETSGPIALVFGREDSGLFNDELDLCSELLVVPANPAHSSLNLAQAVLLIAYELRMAALETAPPLPRPKRRSGPATPADLAPLFDDIQTALHTIEFFKARNAPSVMRSVRALLRRAELSKRESGLLRAMAIEVTKFFRRRGG